MSLASKAEYRRDIDGLRAVAILSVLLYHFGFGCPGGYVGVDIFFVISGYLISGVILRQLADDHFSLLNFWERRVRRIFPAAAIVVFGVTLAGWIYFTPADCAILGKSLAAQAVLASNIYFQKTAGYFTGRPDELPLLHTWSLAVEEQFYLFFPVLLIFIHRYRMPRFLLSALAGISVLSFTASVYGVRFHPNWTYFMLPTRAWELLLGAILNAIPPYLSLRGRLAELSAWLGLGAIIAAIFGYDNDTPFPGISALLPCLGSAIIIWSNSAVRTSVGKMLSFPPFVFVGLISYSLYLWHWPLIVFAKYLTDFALPVKIYVLIASFVLATLSLYLIETPIRIRHFFKTKKRIFLLYSAMTAAFFVTGILFARTRRSSSRFTPQALQYLAARGDVAFGYDMSLASALNGKLISLGRAAENQRVFLLVWGDSHAMSVLPVVDVLCRKYNVRGSAATHGATAPLLDYASRSVYSLRHDSIAYNRAIINYVVRNRVARVLLVAKWDDYASPTSTTQKRAEFNVDLSKTVTALHCAGAKVYILLTVPTPGFDVPRALARASLNGSDRKILRMPYSSQLPRSLFEHRLFSGQTASGVVLLDPTTYFLDLDDCYEIERDGWCLYFDSNHLTVHGAMLLSDLLKPIFED